MKNYILFATVSVYVLCVENNLFASLHRTFSTNPRLDALKIAIITNESELVYRLLPECLPANLEAHYAFFCLATTSEIKTYVLQAAFSSWQERILASPKEGIKELRANEEQFIRLCKNPEKIDADFLRMLIELKNFALSLEVVASNEQVRQNAMLLYDTHHWSLRAKMAHLLASSAYASLEHEGKIPAELSHFIEGFAPVYLYAPPLVEQ